jgi:alpha-beta hydrolase superfamily lysophospholipase
MNRIVYKSIEALRYHGYKGINAGRYLKTVVPAFNAESDGTEIYYQCRHSDESGSVLVIVHGWGEHGGRYSDMADYMAEKNLSVYAPDLRGHGLSGGARGHVNDFGDYIRDLERLMRIVREKEGEKKTFLFGHSLGALIALEYANTHPVDGLILSGFGLRSAGRLSFLGRIPFVNSVPIPVLTVSARLLGKRAISGLCNNQSALEEYLRDRLGHGAFTLRFLEEISRESERLKGRENFGVGASLILIGSEDRIGSLEDARWLYSSLASDKKLIVYEGMKHNIFDETEKERVFYDVHEWITEH